MHSHSKFIVLASLIYSGNEFRVRNLEMIKVSNHMYTLFWAFVSKQIYFNFKIAINIRFSKGIYHPTENRMFRYDEELVVPIIENTCFERDLTDPMLDAMKRYPNTNAVIVRRHGIYVWGNSWEQCKAM